jgi:hypothetical protein
MNSALIWDSDWAWSLPLIVITVVLHGAGLGVINRGVRGSIRRVRNHRNFNVLFMMAMGVTTLLATVLHAMEAGLWAATYWLLGAVPDGKSAVLYSLNAITTYGHSDVQLTSHWQLMGSLEALNGMLLFGLTTAFLYGVIQHVWPAEREVPVQQ